jgi:hypothetical protein
VVSTSNTLVFAYNILMLYPSRPPTPWLLETYASFLTMRDMRNSSIFIDMYIQSVRVIVLCDNRTRGDDTCLLWQFLFAEGLANSLLVFTPPSMKENLISRASLLSLLKDRHRTESFQQAYSSILGSCRQCCWPSRRVQRVASWKSGVSVYWSAG